MLNIKNHLSACKNVKERYILANNYFKFLGKRTKLKTFKERIALKF